MHKWFRFTVCRIALIVFIAAFMIPMSLYSQDYPGTESGDEPSYPGIPPTGGKLEGTLGWTFNDRTGVRIRFPKRATDRYMIVHTNHRILGSVISHQFGHATTTFVPMGKYSVPMAGPSSFQMRAWPKGKVYVKLFQQ